MKTFRAKIELIGVNPHVLLPDKVLTGLFADFGKDRGSIPVKGTVDGHEYSKFLVKYSGQWRLYLNGITRKATGKQVGDTVSVTVAFDDAERITGMPPGLEKALDKNKKAKAVYDGLSPSLQKEIKRYINNLKSAEAVERNTLKAVGFLTGSGRFIGREAIRQTTDGRQPSVN